MRHGSLFSGIGGFDLAAEWMGWENVFQVEWDKYCQKVLVKNFTNVKRYGDIKEFDGTEYRGLIDILTGGFPCQPFSVAGKQKGKGDDRYLWPEMLRVIREIQSSWIISENVPGIIRMELENICLALESEGYEVQPFIIPSASIGAWDKRDRIWIIAHNNKFGCNNEQKGQIKTIQNEIRNSKIEKQGGGKQQCGTGQSDIIITDTQEQRIRQLSVQQWRQNKASNINSNRETKINPHIESTISEQSGKTRAGWNGRTNSISDIIGKGLQRYSRNDLSSRQKEQERQTGQTNWSRPWIEVASELCGGNARVLNRMDRIKSLGNSVNPYVAYQIFKVIEEYNAISHDKEGIDRAEPKIKI